MKECKSCGSPLEEGAITCGDCGKEQTIPPTDAKKLTKSADHIASEELEKTTVKKKSGSKIVALLLLLLLIVGSFVGVKKFSPKAKIQPTEHPMLYINSDELIRIKTSDMENAADLGNQGFATETKMMPVVLSEDNRKIAYLTALKSLFVVPIEDAKSGIIDSKYLVAENVSEVLAFAPDNNDIFYYIDENNALAAYNGKETTVISENFFLDEENIGISIFAVANNNRILYYEQNDGTLTLCTQVFGKPSSIKQFGDSISNGIYEFDDQGFFFYENRGDYEADGLTLSFFDFKTEESKELTTTQNLYGIIAMDSKGSITLLETLPNIETELSEDIVPDTTEEAVETETPTEGERSDSTKTEVTEIDLENVVIEEPELFSVYIYNSNDKILVADQINSPVYTDSEGDYIIYGKNVDNKVNYYYQSLLNQTPKEPVLLFESETSLFIEFTQSKNNNNFALSKLNDDQLTTTVTIYQLGTDGNITGETEIANSVFSLLPNTVNDNYIFKENLIETETKTGALYTTDLYTYINGEYKKIAEGVDHFSVAQNLGMEQHDSVLLFINNIIDGETMTTGTLNIYDGDGVTPITENFVLPNPESAMPVVFENKELIYYFNYPDIESSSMSLSVYDGTGENKLIEDGVLGVI